MKKTLILISSLLLLTGCDSKKSHYKDGGTLVCIEKNTFSSDRAVFINNNNSSYTSMAGRFDFRKGFRKDGDFFDIDDCAKK